MKNSISRRSFWHKAIFTVAFTCFITFLNAQVNSSWSLQSEKNGVKLYAKTETCGSSNMLLLKVENTNSTNKHVNYNIIIESPGHNMPLLPQSVELKASETKAGDCATNKELTTDIKDITNPKLMIVMAVN